MTYRRFVASQSIIMMAGSMVFPFLHSIASECWK